MVAVCLLVNYVACAQQTVWWWSSGFSSTPLAFICKLGEDAAERPAGHHQSWWWEPLYVFNIKQSYLLQKKKLVVDTSLLPCIIGPLALRPFTSPAVTHEALWQSIAPSTWWMSEEIKQVEMVMGTWWMSGPCYAPLTPSPPPSHGVYYFLF